MDVVVRPVQVRSFPDVSIRSQAELIKSCFFGDSCIIAAEDGTGRVALHISVLRGYSCLAYLLVSQDLVVVVREVDSCREHPVPCLYDFSSQCQFDTAVLYVGGIEIDAGESGRALDR